MTNAETKRLADEARLMCCRLYNRLTRVEADGDEKAVRWLHKQIISVERRAQEREA
jgi:hypothetical protein